MTRPVRIFLAALLLVTFTLPTAHAASVPPFKPALVYLYAGNESDRAFTDAARAGVERAMAEFDTEITEHRMDSGDDLVDTIRRVASSGANPVIAVGYQYVMPVLNVAERFPNTQFTVIDGLVPPLFPNVQSIIFKDHEGAFLVGLIAAKAAKNNHIGFIGGMDIPLIRNFAQGYAQGARYAKPNIRVDVDMVGNTAAAWSDPQRAAELAQDQFKAGAEVIFAAAGGSSIGVLEAADQAGKYAIGVDTNQNGLFPGHVLTSLVKRVDIAVYDTLKTTHEGKWSPGIKYLGIREGALDYAVDTHNQQLITERLIDDVSTAKERIINGIITVEMYSPK